MAIALDNVSSATAAGGTSISWNHGNTAGNKAILTAGVPLGATVTATYNGVSMTEVDKAQSPSPDGRYIYQFYIDNPPIGTSSVVINSSVSDFLDGTIATYTGMASGAPVATTTNTANGASSMTTSLNTTADNSWTVLSVRCNATATAGTGSTSRGTPTEAYYFDSNAAITPAGSYSMTVNASGSRYFSGVMASYAPTGSTTINSNFFLFHRT